MARPWRLQLINYLINFVVGKKTGRLAAINQLKPPHLPTHLPTHIAQVYIAVDRPRCNDHYQLRAPAICRFGTKKRPY